MRVLISRSAHMEQLISSREKQIIRFKSEDPDYH